MKTLNDIEMDHLAGGGLFNDIMAGTCITLGVASGVSSIAVAFGASLIPGAGWLYAGTALACAAWGIAEFVSC